MSTRPDPPRETWRESPTAWFAVLESATKRGDIMAAAQAKSELARLGVSVTYPPARREGARHA